MTEAIHRKKKPLNVGESGKLGRTIFNDIINGIDDLVPIKGRIVVEVNLEVVDEQIFGDDESRKSRLLIEVDLAENPNPIKPSIPTKPVIITPTIPIPKKPLLGQDEDNL